MLLMEEQKNIKIFRAELNVGLIVGCPCLLFIICDRARGNVV